MPDHLRARHHAVQFYASDDTLTQTVSGFLAAGLIIGEPAVVIATPAHSAAILDALTHRLINVEGAKRLGDLICLDAHDVLSSFMRADIPDPEAFRSNVGHLMTHALCGRTGTSVRAYGEMVDVLLKRGHEDAAIALEVMWNDLAHTHPFQLLCGYSLGNFYQQTHSFERICDQHTHVLTEGDALPFKHPLTTH